MQLKDLFPNAGSDLVESVKTVFFRMLPRGAQIQKVRDEFNRGVLKKYGKMTSLEIDKECKTIKAILDLRGEKEGIQIALSNYRLLEGNGKNLSFELGTVEVSREWLDALLKTLLKKNVIPEQIEVKNQLHQTVLKSLLQ